MLDATIIFVFSISVIAYVYFGYPFFLWLASFVTRHRRHGMSPHAPAWQPHISVLVPARNEEATIGAKLQSLLALDYPRDATEILVGDDGSSDRTAEIVRQFAADGVRLVSFPRCQGKSTVQNRLAECASGEIFVFTDADCLVPADAASLLVENFVNPQVGLVTGRANYVNSTQTSITEHESIYLRYDTWLRSRESELGILAMASGSFFAIRRSQWSALDENSGDDFVFPLRVLRSGMLNVLDSQIVASTAMVQDSPRDFLRMKTRIITRDFHTLLAHRDLLDPVCYGAVAFGLWSHKLLRWLVPYFLILLLLTTFCFPSQPLRCLLYLQIAFYAAALAGLAGRNTPATSFLRTPLSFCLVNLAALLGTLNWCLGRTQASWHTRRSTPCNVASSAESTGVPK